MQDMKKNIFSHFHIFILYLAVIAAAVTGCAGTGSRVASDDIKIYYVNKEITGTVPVSSGLYDTDANLNGEQVEKDNKTEELVDEIMDRMRRETDSLEYTRAVPENVECKDCYITSDILNIVFDEEYYTMEPLREILCRQALVSTFVQLREIKGVRIYVGEELLKDANGAPVGVMTADSFVINPGKQINSINSATITLYFSNADGTGLVPETQSVYYNSNVPLEKLIVEHLIAGPKSEGMMAALPAETGLADLTVADGVCFVSFDSGFEKYNYNVNEAVVIYSIVDSLTELAYVDRVQISINGDNSRNYRDDISLSVPFERDMTYISPVKESSAQNSVIVNDVKREDNGVVR